MTEEQQKLRNQLFAIRKEIAFMESDHHTIHDEEFLEELEWLKSQAKIVKIKIAKLKMQEFQEINGGRK